MRWLAALLILAATPSLGLAAFDHFDHDTKVAVSGSELVTCAACHRGPDLGKQSFSHRACFGKCHAPKSLEHAAIANSRLCESCHNAGERRFDLGPSSPDFTVTMSHKRHAAAACDKCHTKKLAPHQRCLGCHKATPPTMQDCTGCHAAGIGPAPGPHLMEAKDSLPLSFTHEGHGKVSNADCRSCHNAVLETDEVQLPRPSKAVCSQCHDGKVAFSTTEPTCRKCHQRPREGELRLARAHAIFAHPKHAQSPCADCHSLQQASAHSACAKCHAADFASRRPTTCGVCHAGNEPWRPLHQDGVAHRSVDFGIEFSHNVHGPDCVSCHSSTGHMRCTECHEKQQKPVMNDCQQCHQLGLRQKREQERGRQKWNVRRNFRHDQHENEPLMQGKQVPCVDCHSEMLGATSLSTIATPKKRTCVRCHNGGIAFKVTGTQCARCHGSALKAR